MTRYAIRRHRGGAGRRGLRRRRPSRSRDAAEPADAGPGRPRPGDGARTTPRPGPGRGARRDPLGRRRLAGAGAAGRHHRAAAALAMAGLTRLLDPGPAIAPGIHPTAVVDPSATHRRRRRDRPVRRHRRRRRASAPCPRSRPMSASAEGARIGDDAPDRPRRPHRRPRPDRRPLHRPAQRRHRRRRLLLRHARQVRCRARARNPGRSGRDRTRQSWTRIHSLGGVSSSATTWRSAPTPASTRAPSAPTRIGTGTKIDNLVTIGHNVVGRAATACCAARSASPDRSAIGDRVVLGGQVRGRRQHLRRRRRDRGRAPPRSFQRARRARHAGLSGDEDGHASSRGTRRCAACRG